MGVYIPNMEKPKFCDGCDLVKYWVNGSFYCMADGKELNIEADIRKDCPLIEIVHCKDCKWFELDVWGELNGIPVIVAHEMCKFWGNGCKTNPNAFCSYGERRDDEHMD